MNKDNTTLVLAIFQNAFELEKDGEIKKITVDSRFENMPLNSILFIKILVQIEDAFHIKFNPEEMDVTEYKVVSDLINTIDNKKTVSDE